MLLDLLTAPVGLPIAGIKFVLQQILDMAERELYDEDRIREDLMLLQLKLDDGDITEEEYAQKEEDVMERLRAARAHRRAAAERAGEADSGPTTAVVEFNGTGYER